MHLIPFTKKGFVFFTSIPVQVAAIWQNQQAQHLLGTTLSVTKYLCSFSHPFPIFDFLSIHSFTFQSQEVSRWWHSKASTKPFTFSDSLRKAQKDRFTGCSLHLIAAKFRTTSTALIIQRHMWWIATPGSNSAIRLCRKTMVIAGDKSAGISRSDHKSLMSRQPRKGIGLFFEAGCEWG